MSRLRLRWVLWVVAAAGVWWLVRAKLRPRPVEACGVQSMEVTGEVMGTGTLEARVKTTISPRIQEQLVEVLVDQNEMVEAGQLLALLDGAELRQQVEVAEANLEAARATVERVRVEEARTQAVEQQARLHHQRISELMVTQVSSEADLDKAVEQLRVAEADQHRARAMIVESESLRLAAEKNLAYQRERLAYTRIVSPYRGLIIRRDRDPGGVVVPGGSLMQLISTNEIWVSAWVDETVMTALAVGQPAKVVFRSDPSRSYPGAVARLGKETDRETREFLVDVRVEELPANWTIGQRAEVYIETGRNPAALAVPERFVHWQAGKAGVFVDRNGRAEWQTVTLGLAGAGRMEVTSGLSAGDTVVAAQGPGLPALKSGQRIIRR